MSLIFDYSDYRAFLKDRIREMPNAGHGQLRRLAEYLGVHGSLLSQVLGGEKNLNSDHAALTTEYLGLGTLEADFFMALVQYERAGTDALKKMTQRLMEELKKKAGNIREHLTFETILNEENKAVFYSSWTFSAIRQVCAIGDGKSFDELSRIFPLSQRRLQKAVNFLLSSGLCIQKENRIQIGLASTFVDADSYWIKCHHRNWRDRALVSIDLDRESSFHYSIPMTLSKKDAEKIRSHVVEFVKKINSVVDPSPSEEMRCLNIDWFDPL